MRRRVSLLTLLTLLLLTLAVPGHSRQAADPDPAEPEPGEYLSVPDEEDIAIAILLEPGETEEARLASLVAKWEAATRASPGDFAAWVKLGIAYQKQGKHDQALVVLAKALELEPGAGAVRLLMVGSMVAAGPIPVPRAPVTAAAAYVPDAADVQVEALLELGDTNELRLRNLTTRLDARLQANTADFEARVKLAIALQMQGRHGGARSHLEAALATEPAVKSLYALLASSLTIVDPGLKVYVNGRTATLDVPPVLMQGRTLLPLRGVAEQLGAQVDWNAETSTATVTLGPNAVQVTRDSTRAVVNGLEVTLDVPATIMNGRTMLPLRFVGEGLNKLVEYYPGDQPGSALIVVRDK